MFTKFAKAEILDVRTSDSRVKNAKLNKFSSIGEEPEHKYRIQDGYIYTKVRAISSRVNKNHDGWPSQELAKAYDTFVGKPIFVDHNNSDPSRARGVVIDARLHVEDDLKKASALDPYYASAPDNHKPPTWIELLLETDARQFPKLAKAIISGDIDSVSMGANVERTQCNICDNWATSTEEYCDHVNSKGAEFDFVSSTGERTSRRSYEDCYDIGFFEISYVFDPADETALVLDRISKVAAEKKDKHKKVAVKPQVDLQRSPEEVNTLRQEKVCDLCGNSMEDGKCDVCGYEQPEDALLSEHQPPESLADPDLEQAQQNLQQRQAEGEMEIPGLPGQAGGPPAVGLPAPFESRPGPGGPASLNLQSTVKGKKTADINSEWAIVKNGGLITRIEKPILPPSRITSDKVVNPKPVSKSQKPVESKNKENKFMSNQAKLDEALEQLNQYLAAKTAAEPTWNDSEEHEADLEAVGGEMTGDAEKHTQQEALVQNPSSDMVAPHTQTFPNKNQADAVDAGVGSAGQGPIGVAASANDEDKDEDKKEKSKHEKKESPAKEKAEHKDGEEKKEKGEKKLPAFLKKEESKTAMFPDDNDIMDRDDMDGMNGIGFDEEDAFADDEIATHEGDDILERIRAEWGEEAAQILDQIPADDMIAFAEAKMDSEQGGPEEDLGMGMEMEEMDMGEGMDEGMEPPRMAKKKKSVEYFNAENTALQVDVAAPIREEIGPDTKTFGSDAFHITQPVTQDGNGNDVGGPIGQAMSRSEIKSHIFRALKVAEVEVSLGLIPEEEKFDRAADLEDESSAELKVREETLATVKKANLSKPATKRVAGRVPSLKTAGVIHSYVEPNSTEIEDSALFS